MNSTGTNRATKTVVATCASLTLGAGLLLAGPAVADPGGSRSMAANGPSSVTTPTASKAPNVKWDWTMPTFMVDKKTFVPVAEGDTSNPNWFQGGYYVPGPDGIPDKEMRVLDRFKNAGNAVYGKIPRAGTFKAKLDASKTTGNGKLRCSWSIQADPTVTKKNKNCAKKTAVWLPEGRHRLTLTVKDSKNRTTKVASHIVIKNTLVSIMGDSYASGVGRQPFTEKAANGVNRQLDWDYPSCNRTRWSGFVRAAQELESADKRSNVTLINVACAGGEVQKGYLRQIDVTNPPVIPPQTSEKETGGILFPKRRLLANGVQKDGYEQPQIDQLRKMARGGTVDTVFLSIGGNDAGLSDIGIACAVEDVGVKSCYNQVPFFWDNQQNQLKLYEIADKNLVELRKRYDRMAPCFGAKSSKSCKTWKLENGTPATKKTKSNPVTLAKNKNLIHAAYPDLTTTRDAQGTLEPCSNRKPFLESPMNQISNSWAWDTVYVGKKGEPYTLPSTYSPPLNPPNPATLTPAADGILNQLKTNKSKYGWSVGKSMLWDSRGHGLCAGDEAWEYGLNQAIGFKNPAASGAALHPNDTGQQEYADMLGRMGLKRTNLPVDRPSTVVVPSGGLG